jgi:signal transduction histidine kinase
MMPAVKSRRRSIVWRIASASMLIAILAIAILFTVSYSAVERSSAEALAATVTTDLAGLIDIHASSGEAELIRRVADRKDVVSLEEGRRPHYLIARADGRPIGGDLKAWPHLSAALSEQGYLTLPGSLKVYARAARLSPDLQLLVAREYRQDRATLARLARIFLGVGAGIVIVVALVAVVMARSLARRIERIKEGLRGAAEGYPVALDSPSLPGDEIDELARQGARLLARQAQLVRLQKHMSDHVAHEIRTPLMHLDGRLASALQARPEPEGGALTRSRGDIRGIVAMLDSLLDIASNEGRRGDLAGLVELNLSELLADLAALYEGSVEEAGLTLETAIEPGVTMLAERMQIVRLVSNLLDNAIKYVPSGGHVSLSLAPGPRITVSDDGPGIPREERGRIFERFGRGAGQVSQPGHGLGLALARAIAQRHGLILRLAESERGACFVLEPEA